MQTQTVMFVLEESCMQCLIYIFLNYKEIFRLTFSLAKLLWKVRLCTVPPDPF